VFTRVHELEEREEVRSPSCTGGTLDYFPHSEVKKPSLINSCTKLLS
jgi:hypothetical protein